MTADWNALQRAIAGDVVIPESADYESLRAPAMARFADVRPSAVVRCRTSEDVAETLRFTRAIGVHVALRSGGHCFAGRSSTAGVVIDVAPMSSVHVASGLVTVGAGTRLADLYDALARHELTIPAGCGPTVGIVGLTLGGGHGILGRTYGLTCDRLVAARVVLADGRVVDCDEHRDADLFWALRGAGGGQFGVTTSLTFEPVAAPAATMFHLVWPHASAVQLITAWQDWAPDAPDELAATLQLAVAHEADAEPVVSLSGAMVGSVADTVELLGGLCDRAGTDPLTAVHDHLPYRAVKRALAGLGGAEGEAARPLLNRSEYFRAPLPVDAVTTLVRRHAAGRRPGTSRELNFTPWGGAYNRIAPEATAFPHRDERFLVEHVLTADPEEFETGQEWLHDSWATAHRWGAGGVYPNFPDPLLTDWKRAYHGDNFERLRRVKHHYDEGNAFRFEQSIA